jgi:predicted flap endonuclease-1-like 5' DNA nuclease
MSSLKIIEGIGEVYAAKLRDAGISSVEDLLATCAAKIDRAEIAESTGISEKLILKWANYADLARIKGIAGQYAELLEAAGVDTVPELAQRNPENLMAKMIETNEAKKLVRKVPTVKQLGEWIACAKELPRILNY